MKRFDSGLIISVILLSLASYAACSGESDTNEVDSYDVKGRYLSTDMRGESISVIHEEVPDVMPAMRMNFRIDDESDAAELEPGDAIRFDMVRTEAGWYARNITALPADTRLDLPENLQDVGRR